MSIIEKAMEKALQERLGNPKEHVHEPAMPPQHEPDHKPKHELKSALHHAPDHKSDHAQHTQNLEPSCAPHEQDEQTHTEISQESTTVQAQDQAQETRSHAVEHEQPTTINPIPELIMASNEALTLGGSYRLLKECILAVRKNEPDKTLFMITSAMRNEGKTLTACNLACALAAEYDSTVLLIDVDLRAPSCQRVLGIKNTTKGLSDCLLHNVPIHECLIHTGIGKLSVLSAGSIIDNPAELINSRRMQDFLQEIKHRYPDRIIIIDSLPLLPFAESRALSRMVDGVMLVVRENVTYKSHVDTALQHLQDVPLLGMIYNAATAYGTEKDIFNYSYYGYDAEAKK